MMTYDQEPVEPTQRFIDALCELMRAEMEMMRKHEPEMAHCWTWGVCKVGDISTVKGFSFRYGGEEDKPDDFPPETDVYVKFKARQGDE